MTKKHEKDHECNCKEEHHDCKCKDDGASKKEKNIDYLELSQRIQAEFDNYRKRNALLAVEAKEEGVIKVIEKLLPVLDSFKAAEAQANEKELVGLQLIKEQMQSALASLGVEQIEAKDASFDPNLHNAIMVGEEENKESQVVLEVLQEGYKVGKKVVRHAVVKINK